MRKFASLMTTISLGMAAMSATPALAQGAATAAPTINLAPGTLVYDSEGATIGPVASDAGDNVVVTLGDKPVTLPKNAFAATDKGPAITITVAQLSAAINQAAQASAAALDAALVAGADIYGADGLAIIGKVKSADASGVIVSANTGAVTLPRDAFFISAKGLATSFTAAQFAAAVQQASSTAAADDAAVRAALKTGIDVHDISGTAVLGSVKSFDANAVVVATASGDVSLPIKTFNMKPSGLAANYTAEQFADTLAQVTGSSTPPSGATAEADASLTDKPVS